MSIASPPRLKPSRPAIDPAAARQQLDEQLRLTRERAIRQRIATAVCRLMVLAALALGVIAVADYFLELATTWRALGLLAILVGFIAASIRAWRQISAYSLTQAARDAEARAAQFGQRLRTTLDYDDEPRAHPAHASTGLLEALHTETYQVAQQADWDAMVDGRPLLKAVMLGAGCAVVWFVALLVSPEFRLATGRALLLPLQYTTVTYAPQTSTIKFGESVTIDADVSGRPISSAQVRYRPAGSQEEWTTVDLLPADAAPASESEEEGEPVRLHGALLTSLAKLERDLEFEVLAGPLPLPPGSIRVLQPLKLEKPSARIIPPQYTRKEEETVAELNLKVLEGSSVELTLTLNREAGEGYLTAKASDEKSKAQPPIPFTIDGPVLRATLADLRKSTSFNITAKAVDGIELTPLELNIKVKLDRPPNLQFIQPPEELSVTATTDVPMIVEAGDDLGLHKVGILYQVGDGEMKPLYEDDAAGSAEPFQGSTVLMLEDEKLSYQDAVTYYGYAEDNYFGKPRRVTTPLRFIDIRPYKMAFTLSEGGGSCNGCSVTLEELIMRQRQQLAMAFAAQQQTTVAPELLAKFAEGEADLLAKTEEFLEGLVALAGPIPILDEAAADMETAVEALKAEQLEEGVTAEQQALAKLIKGRENVRKKINQSPSQSQCQKFDREQKQKLRLPEKKQQDEQQKQAEARKKLNDLAQRERKWSQQASQSCQNPSSSQSSKPSQSQSQSQSQSESSSSPSSSQPMGEPMPMQTAAEKAEQREAAAKAQQEMLAELESLKQQIAQLGKKSDAAQQQAEQAGESMKKGLEELKKQDGDAAAKAGERSADELEQLAAHLAAMNAKDVGQRLEQAQQLAQQLAAGEQKIEKELGGGKKEETHKPGGEGQQGEKQGDKGDKPGDQTGNEQGNKPGGEKPGDEEGKGEEGKGEGKNGPGGKSSKELAAKQKGLATQGKLLEEQLEALRRDAAAEPGNLGQKLAQSLSENPPEEITAAMEQAAEDLKANRRQQAGRGVSQSRERLEELGRALGGTRSELTQPQLQELMKLEEQLAQLRERAKQAGGKLDAASEEKWQQLAAKIEALSDGDKRLAKAVDRLRASEFRREGQPLPPGVYPEMELLDAPSLNEVAKALQTKIQEAILAAAIMDADQPVPTQYKELVEKYYKALSDDLR
jgi:chemotaxis protein histidine kinase CheA